MSKPNLLDLQKEYGELKSKGLSLDMSRGKPESAQLDLSNPMVSILDDGNFISESGMDTRNYSEIMGIPEARRLFSEIFDIPASQVIAGGSSSLNMICDAIKRCFFNGAEKASQPWSKLEKVKFICPVPGYDWHFHICDTFGIEMIPVEMDENGPIMDVVEGLVKDPGVKGMIAVPMYSNPTGVTFSDDTVLRLAKMQTAAADFRIFWDNAYCMHNLYDDRCDHLANIYVACKKFGHENRPLIFTSTSKITFAGGGICAMGASPANIEHAASLLQYQMVCYDKVNQLRHTRFLPNKGAVEEHMKKHAAILRPKFELVSSVLERELGDLNIASCHKPLGGYFICFNAQNGCAKRIVELCAEAGVKLTPAGAAFPHGIDPSDSVIRLAPTYPSLEELGMAVKVFVASVKLATAEKMRAFGNTHSI